MGVFDFGSVPTNKILEISQMASAVYEGGAPPTGWTALTGTQVGFVSGFNTGTFEGDTFEASSLWFGAPAAQVYRKGNELTISFRGTDSGIDYVTYLDILGNNNYINAFNSFLDAVKNYAESNGISNINVTGHSLGAAAANILRNVSGSDFEGFYDNATYITIASPKISGSPNILNIGFENDWVFETISRSTPFVSSDFFSATDNIVLFDDAYADGDWPGFVFGPDDTSSHGSDFYIDAISRIIESEFYSEMSRDSTIVVSATDSQVSDKDVSTSDHFGSAAFFVGREEADDILGGTSTDYIDGAGGNDTLSGGGGNDELSGGAGQDLFLGTQTELDGDTILDLEIGDRIGVLGVTIDAGNIASTDTTISFGTATINAVLPEGSRIHVSDETLEGGGSIIEVIEISGLYSISTDKGLINVLDNDSYVVVSDELRSVNLSIDANGDLAAAMNGFFSGITTSGVGWNVGGTQIKSFSIVDGVIARDELYMGNFGGFPHRSFDYLPGYGETIYTTTSGYMVEMPVFSDFVGNTVFTPSQGFVQSDFSELFSDYPVGETGWNNTNSIITVIDTAVQNGGLIGLTDGAIGAQKLISLTVPAIPFSDNAYQDILDLPASVNFMAIFVSEDGDILASGSIVDSSQFETGSVGENAIFRVDSGDQTVELIGLLPHTASDFVFFGTTAELIEVLNDSAPTANNDSYSTAYGTSILIDVLSNDEDSDGTLDVSSLAIESNPASGIAFVENGQIRYLPSSGFSGVDIFTYSIQDDAGNKSNVATVTVTVGANPNVAPTDITLSANGVDENATNNTLIGSLLALDANAGDTHSYQLIENAEGRFALDGANLVVADGTQLDYEANMQHTIIVRATDAGGLTFDKTLTISVNDQNEDTIGTDGSDDLTTGAGPDQINLGGGSDILRGLLENFFGDRVEDFGSDDAIIFEGSQVERGNITVTQGSAILAIDSDGDGTTDGQFTLSGDFTGGDFMALIEGADTHVTFETFLPLLREGQAVNPALVNGIINQEFLKGDGSTDFQVTLRDMGHAGYNNVVGVYEIDASGNIVDARILFDNANANKTAVAGITDVEAGHKLGFFIVQNAASWAGTLAQSDVLSFINGSGASGNVSDGSALSLAVNGVAVDEMVFHSFAADMNSDGVQHALSGVDVGGEAITVGFEDLTGGGDRDYEDVVFRVETVDDFIFV